jgi:hypothetical protein
MKGDPLLFKGLLTLRSKEAVINGIKDPITGSIIQEGIDYKEIEEKTQLSIFRTLEGLDPQEIVIRNSQFLTIGMVEKMLKEPSRLDYLISYPQRLH